MIVSCMSMVAVLLVLSSIISKDKKISSETETARDIQIRSSVVVPINHTEGSGTAHIYAALKLQQNVRNALHKKLAAKVSDDEKSVDAIQKKSSNHRNRAVAQIKKRHTARSTSIHAKVDARNKAKRSKALQMCSIFSELHDVSICKIIDQMHYDVVQIIQQQYLNIHRVVPLHPTTLKTTAADTTICVNKFEISVKILKVNGINIVP